MSVNSSGNSILPNTRLIPLNYVIKYEPPLIGMVFRVHENDKKKRMYKIYLHGLIYKNDTESITNQLFQEHPMYLNEKFIAKSQIRKLVDKLLSGWRKQNGVSSKENLINKESTAELLSMNAPKGGRHNEAINIQDFENYPHDAANQRKKMYQQVEVEDDNELDRNIDELDPKDLEFEEKNWDNDHLDQRHGQASKGNQEKKAGNNKISFLKNLAEIHHNQHENEMDYILDDPDNLASIDDI